MAAGVEGSGVARWPQPCRWLLILATAASTLLISAAFDIPASSAPQTSRQPGRASKAQPPKPVEMPGRDFTAEEQLAAVIPGMPDARFWANSEVDFRRNLPQVDGPWLAISAGGAGGAFGAGLLVGLTRSGKRPDYAVVTGVSGGALIAPYAFAGPKYDEELRKAFTEILASDIFEAAATKTSFLDTWPMKSTLAKRITPELLADIAAEHRRGRRLFIVTTNIDAEQTVAWNMGAIAAHGGDKALKLFRDVLLASSSIPGLFPPVFIEAEANGKQIREMHADGGMGGQFYIAPENWMSAKSRPIYPINSIHLILNYKLTPEFAPPDRNPTTLSVIGLGIATTVKTAARLEAMGAHSAARLQGIDLKLAYVPSEFHAVSRGVIDPEYMKALFELGVREGMSGNPFRTEPLSFSAPGTDTHTPRTGAR